MKIIYLSNSKIPSNTANSVHVMKMCQALSISGHDVTLLGLKNSKSNKKKIFDLYNVMDSFKLCLVPVNISKINSLFLLILSLMKSIKGDLIYSRWRVGTLIISLFLKKDIYFEYHLIPENKLYRRIESYLIRNNKISKHIFITNALKNDYINMYPELNKQKCIVLPDGADIPLSSYSSPKESNEKSKLKICYVGSFFPGKGIDLVIELTNRIKHVEFHIIGGKEGEVEKYKKITEHKNVIFYGYRNQEEVSCILSEMDIGLLPNQPSVLIEGRSSFDIGAWTSPMKLFEYMAHKTAIIASDLNVLKEILIENVNAKLVKYDDVDEWVNIITELNENREEVNRLSDNAFSDLKNKYSWEIRAKKALNK